MLRDDHTKQGKVVYLILCGMYFMLFLMGTYNLYEAYKLNKFRHSSMCCFYITFEIFVILRILLFSDAIIDFNSDSLYLYLLLVAPCYLYIQLALNQALMNIEIIIFFKLEKIRTDMITSIKMKEKYKRRYKILLKFLHLFIWIVLCIIIATFVVLMTKDKDPTN